MQGKGIIKFFLVVMLLVTIAQYLFVLPTNAIEGDADEYAQDITGEDSGDAYRIARASYLDSIGDQEAFRLPLLKSYTYNELKQQQLALGLDLKGGMSAVLQVDLEEFLRALAKKSKDPTFEEALQKASQAQKNAQDDYVALFADAWQEVRGDKNLAPIFQRNDALRDEIGLNTTDAEVIRILREKADRAVQLTYDLLRNRIDQLGVVQPNISLDAERDLIIAELPGIENRERARQMLVTAANLEFYDVKRIDQTTVDALIAADQLLDRRQKAASGEEVDEEEIEVRYDTTYALDANGTLTDEIERIDTVETAPAQTAGPLFSLLSPTNGSYGEAVVGIGSENNRDAISALLEDEEVARLFPRDAIFRWSAEALPGADGTGSSNVYQLYQLKMPRGGEAELTGQSVTRASSSPDPSGQIAVNLSMNSEGARTWAKMTTDAANDRNRQVAIVLDEQVVSAPRVNGAITGGNTAITGDFSVQEAEDLANILQVGQLPARPDIIQESVVGPSLGASNIRSSIIALLVGFGLVLAFMLIYYGGAGIVAIVALLLNVVFIFGALASLGTVLTLPGIAGILLTIGMAVDANVIIYERVREELRAGKTVVNAVQDGFANSYSAIIDANVTTILVAAVLAYFGLGPIKGFAVVLIVGVIASVFTAVLVGRLMVDWWLNRNDGKMTFSTGLSEGAFSNLSIDWMGKRKAAYGLSAVLVVVSLAAIFVRGFDLGVDFKGGYSYVVEFAEDVSADQLRTALADPFGGAPTVKAVDTENTYNVVTNYLVDETDEINGQEPQEVVLAALYEGVKTISTDAGLTLQDFGNTELEEGTHIVSVSKVGPTIADDIKRSSLWAGGIALLGIFLYLLLRFNKWYYSAGAVAALFHDTIIVMGFFALFWGILPFNMEVDQAFIAAILTVIGYSINDTVVVFDRIREFLGNYTSRGKTEIINAAINSTVSRTVITSLTTLLVVLVLFLFGGSSIKGFAFALLVGILVGTYSSIFIATPIVHDLSEDLDQKPVEQRNPESITV